jgi:hypothetical protein
MALILAQKYQYMVDLPSSACYDLAAFVMTQAITQKEKQ